MNLAYIISAYKLPDQLVRLVHTLDGDGVHFFIHVDRKTERSINERMHGPLGSLPNVHFLCRHRSSYGGFGHVEATIKGLRELSSRRIAFDYAILLTGQDYPIQPIHEISEFFRQQEGRSFIEYFPVPHAAWERGGVERFAYRHVRFGGRHVRLARGSRATFERLFPTLRLFGGSAYWCLARECIEYVCGFLQDHPSYERFFRYVDVPEESFFQTVLLNSPLREGIVNDDLRLLEWRNPESAGGPAVLGRDDFPKITRSRKLFARKFDIDQDEEILRLIDEYIGGA